MDDPTSPRTALYLEIQEAAKEMPGTWLRRLAYARIRRLHFRPRLIEEGMWLPCSVENWLATWREGGESLAPWVDEATLGWHAEQSWEGTVWHSELLWRRRPWYRQQARARNTLARALEWPLAWMAGILWRG